MEKKTSSVATKPKAKPKKRGAKSSKRKEIAQILYCEQHKTETEVAAMVGVTQQSIHTWSVKGHWQELRSGISISRKNQIMNLYRQIDRINKQIEQREEDNRVANEDEAKTLMMLAKTIEAMEKEVGLREIVNTGKKFCEFMATLDAEKAQEVNDYWDAFVTNQISKIK